MNLDDKLKEFEGIPCYTAGRTSYTTLEFLQFPAGTKRHTVLQWFADEYHKSLADVSGELKRTGGRPL